MRPARTSATFRGPSIKRLICRLLRMIADRLRCVRTWEQRLEAATKSRESERGCEL